MARVLVACEYSGRVRDAFRAAGHDAVSCDILPSERPGPHIQGDVLELLADGWDALIGFPPCTHLSKVGARHWPAKQADGRQQQAAEFFLALWDCGIPRICLENPAGYMTSALRAPDQYVHPWWWGGYVRKATGLWLKGLPPLVATHSKPPFTVPLVTGMRNTLVAEQLGMSTAEVRALGGFAEYTRDRNATRPELAQAMATQWAPLLDQPSVASALSSASR